MLEGFPLKLRGLVRKGSTHRPIEDLMTSTIIGSLAHMPTDWAFRVLQAILGSPLVPLRGGPSKVDIKLWHRLDRVEPDAVIELVMDGDSVNKQMLLIEAKWDSGFGDDQLKRQRQAFSNHHYHVLLVRREAKAAPHIDDARQVIVTWYQVASGLVDLARDEAAVAQLRRWAKSAAAFLAEMGEHPFNGFCQIALPPVCPPSLPLFYSGR